MNEWDLSKLKEELPVKKEDSHKGDYGKALIIAGSNGMAGAAYLSACAAYTVGAGLVKIYTHESNRVILQQLLPEAILTTYRELDGLQLQKELEWADVIAVGPGIGRDRNAEMLVQQLLSYGMAQKKKAIVADADALFFLGQERDRLSALSAPLIVTPHPGEMGYLCHLTTAQVLANREETIRHFVEQCPTTCVLKGHHTLVLDRNHELYCNHSGNAGMAKAGSGDVLTGVITGLLAQGCTTFKAAVLGVYLHGIGGDLARNKVGVYGMLARDLIWGIRDQLREVDKSEIEGKECHENI